jgi:tRNA A-37 threonylcarbamoyl transferase component Bud32
MAKISLEDRIVIKYIRVGKHYRAKKIVKELKHRRIERCRQLLDRFPNERNVRRVWFTDEKTFTVATPVNTQNDRLYSTATMKKLVSSEPEVTD